MRPGRAAGAWAEALTLLPGAGAHDAVDQAARTQFSEVELVTLTLAIVAINGWNRLAVGVRSEVGNDRVAKAGRSTTAGA